VLNTGSREGCTWESEREGGESLFRGYLRITGGCLPVDSPPSLWRATGMIFLGA
jgi:hypothetical protein